MSAMLLQIMEETDPHQEDINVVTKTDDVLPPSVENDDSDGEVDVVDDLRVDNSISNFEHEFSESEDSDFDNPPLIPIHIVKEERIRREHAEYINQMETDPHQEDIDVVTKTDDVLPPSVENDDSDGEVDVVDDLRVDNSISNSEHEFSESEDSDFDNPLVPLPPPKPPDE
nr:hypothetical protein [Tanacetum cinerariifolium]